MRGSSLWSHPEFLKLWSAYTVSRLGSQITLLALPLTAVLLLGAGATETGLLIAARSAPSIFPGPLLGAWIDRRPRRPVMVAANVGSALVIGSIPVASMLGVLTMWQLYVVSFLAGVFGFAVDLSRSAMLPSLIGRDRLIAANSRMQASGAFAQIAGPSLGGTLVQALSAPIAIAFDAASFLVSAVLLAAIRISETVDPREEGRRLWHDALEGLAFVRRQELLFRSIVAIGLANIEWFAVMALLVVYATDELHMPPALLGIAIAAVGPATLIGAGIAAPLCERFGLGPVMLVALFFETVSRLILPFAAGDEIRVAAIVALTQALVGFTEALWFVSVRTLQQSVTPDRLLGRVGSAVNLVALVVAPPAALLAGLLGDAIGLRPTLLGAGLIAVIAFVYLFASPVRALRAAPVAA